MARLRPLVLLFLLAAAALPARAGVVASIEPLAMTARQVLGDDVQVRTLMRAGQSLHGASLTPEQVRSLRDAELVIWLGSAAEPRLAPLVERRSGPDLALLELDGVHRLHGRAESGHDHGDHAENQDATRVDPHLWLEPANMARLARALAEQRKTDAGPFLEELEATRTKVSRRLAPVRGRGYVSQHDPWGYFARAFDLERALVASDGVAGGASARRLVELAETMNEREVGCVLAEPDARRALLERLCREDCRLVELDPLGRGLDQAGYTTFLRHLAERFDTCLSP